MMSSSLSPRGRARCRRRGFNVALAAAAALTVSALPALAHPHVWVTTHTTVLYENGAIVGLRHDWTFDQYYSAMAIEGLDKNNDGKYSREELAELADVNVKALKEFDYFTYPTLAGAKLGVGEPKDYHLEHTLEKPAPGLAPPPGDPQSGAAKIAAQADQRVPVLTLHFTLPLEKPVLAEAPGFGFSIGDPTFFIAFEPAAQNAVALGQGAPQGCKIEQEEVKEADAKASKPGDLMASQPSDLSINIVSGPVWKVACTSRGSSG